MKLTQEFIDTVRQKFALMSTKEDFVALLNDAKKALIGEKYKPFELRQITYYANPKVSGLRYSKFEIKKKAGGVRTIHAPVKGLALIQRCLNIILQCVFTPHEAVKGFVKGKSIVDNAKVHTGRNYVFNIDLKDFFPSVDQARVWKCLQLPPFNLKDEQQKFKTFDELCSASEAIFLMMWQNMQPVPEAFPGEWFDFLGVSIDAKSNSERIEHLAKLNQIFVAIINKQPRRIVRTFLAQELKVWWDNVTSGRLPIANIIAALCCNEMDVERMIDGEWTVLKRNVLPQGAATSPLLTNVVCQKLDFLLTGVAKRFGLKYTRYADDITFSSNHHVFKENGPFIKELRRIIAQQGFHIKESKVRLQNAAYRQEVTGLVVNKQVNVNQAYIKQLRMWLYNWEAYGYDRAYSYFLPDYFESKTNPIKGKPGMGNVIAGKLLYLRMIKGADNAMYMKLQERFDKLVSKTSAIGHILEIWEKEGIEKAMEAYYKTEITLVDAKYPIEGDPKTQQLLNNDSTSQNTLRNKYIVIKDFGEVPEIIKGTHIAQKAPEAKSVVKAPIEKAEISLYGNKIVVNLDGETFNNSIADLKCKGEFFQYTAKIINGEPVVKIATIRINETIIQAEALTQEGAQLLGETYDPEEEAAFQKIANIIEPVLVKKIKDSLPKNETKEPIITPPQHNNLLI